MRLGGRVCGIYLKLACVALVILGVAVPVVVMMPAMHRHLNSENGAHGHPHHLWGASSDSSGNDGSSADGASEESSDGGGGGGGTGGVDARRWKAIGASDVRAGDFVGLRTHGGKWVARAVETEGKGGAGGGGVTSVSLAEKTWEYRPSKSGHAAFYSWCGTFLALNREPKLAAQVRALSSDAKWTLVPVEDGGVALKGVGRDGADKYVGLVDTTKKENRGMEGYLSCRYKELEHPRTTFRLYRRVDCRDAEACWGDFLAEGRKRAAVDPQEWLGEAVPLFGSPKPFNASDELYEEYRLSYQRLVRVWSSLSSPVRPMMFVEPKDTIGNELTKKEGVPLFEEYAWSTHVHHTNRTPQLPSTPSQVRTPAEVRTTDVPRPILRCFRTRTGAVGETAGDGYLLQLGHFVHSQLGMCVCVLIFLLLLLLLLLSSSFGHN